MFVRVEKGPDRDSVVIKAADCRATLSADVALKLIQVLPPHRSQLMRYP
jgi:hypothetical protein